MKFQNLFLAAAAAALIVSGPAMAGPKKGSKGPVASSSPSVSIVAPLAGATVHGVVGVTVAVPDNVAVKSVVLFLDGYFVDAKSFAPWNLVFQSAYLVPGSHTLQAQTQDSRGVWVKSAIITVNVVPPLSTDDIAAPSKAVIVNPVERQLVSGVVPVQVECADNVGVVCVAVYIDGNPPVLCDGPNAIVLWDTTGLVPGSFHHLQAIAYDATGNYRVAPLVSVQIAG